MKLSVIILSYNTKKLLEQCLQSVYSQTGVKFEVIIVDNASTDGSAQLATIRNKTNLGYAKANNQGIKQARGEYILLLNSDTVVKPHAFKNLVRFLDTHPKAGIASAQLFNPDGSIQPSGGFLPRLSTIFAWMLFSLPLYHLQIKSFYQTTRSLGWVQGAAMIFRKNFGLLDEKLFMYAEDIDFCYRAQKQGLQVWTVADAQVIHHKFQSSSFQAAVLGEYQGLLYYFKKHKPQWEVPLLRILLASGALLRMLIFGTILRDKLKYDIYQKAFRLARS